MKTELPIYVDGKCEVFKLEEKGIYPKEYLVNEELSVWFEELSVFDRLAFEFAQRDISITLKIRIPQTKLVTSKSILKIDEKFHRVFNAAHFVNKDGFKQSDITLVELKGAYELWNE